MICSIIDTDFNEEKWQKLYQKASHLSISCFKEEILQRGIKKEKGCFFHLQKYAQLLQEKGPHHPYVLKCKKKILRKETGFRRLTLRWERKAIYRNGLLMFGTF